MIRKALLIPAILVLVSLMVTSMPKLVSTTQAADVETYIQIIRDLNTPYEDELVSLMTQLNQYLYDGNIQQAKQIGNQLNEILDKLPKDQQDALMLGGCNVTCGAQSCNTANCAGIALCQCDGNNEPVCFCSKNGNCTANCTNGNCNANGDVTEQTVCRCVNGNPLCYARRVPLFSLIGILILITLITGSGIWLWRRKRVSAVT